ncbi:MAG TPA: DUF3015 family protein, partial [Nitrospira sp.]
MSLMLAFITGCTFTGSTEAIFDATPDTTVSDSERIWWTEDGVLKPDYKVVAFAAYDRLNLEQDLARGQGEYLASLGSMLGVQENSRPAFEAAAQQRFEAMAPRDRMIEVQQL